MLTTKERDCLLESFLFSGVDPTALAPLLDTLSSTTFAKEEVVYGVHSFRGCIGFVLEGELLVKKGDSLLLHTLQKGAYFGVAALFSPREYVSTVVAATPATVIFLSEDILLQLFETQPKLAVNYIAFLSQRIQFLNQKIDTFAAPTATGTLCLFLADNQVDGQVCLPGGYTRLARQLGLGRASLYRALGELSALGLVDKQDKLLRILDFPGLLALCPGRDNSL